MSAPHTLFPVMEGILGGLAGANQKVSLWLKHAKELMLCAELKDKTDWEFALSEDIDESGNAVMSGDGTFYGCVIGYNAATAAGDLLCISDATSNTFDGTAALGADDFTVRNLPAATTEDTEEFHCIMIHEGQSLATGLTVAADAQGGTNPGTDDVRGWFLYRTGL